MLTVPALAGALVIVFTAPVLPSMTPAALALPMLAPSPNAAPALAIPTRR